MEAFYRRGFFILLALAALGIAGSVYFGQRASVNARAFRELEVAGRELVSLNRRLQNLAEERGSYIERIRSERDEFKRIGIELRDEQRRREGYIVELERYRDDRRANDRRLEAILLEIADRNDIENPGDSGG